MEVDAYVIDGFSNPSPMQMRERLFPFIENLKIHRPDTPIIFLKSIYREKRNFDLEAEKYETERAFVADSLMKVAVKTFDNIYWVTTTNATDGKSHETSVDGTHPSDYGYTLWTDSVERQIVRILRKHKIK
jgi:lysophospholipase L1-like esterase